MTETQRPIDPEVVGIMQEVVSQPGSTLFNVPTHAIGKPLRLRDEPVSVGEPFLSNAERHLLEVYRDEVADVLLQACRDKLTERPAEETMIFPCGPSADRRSRKWIERLLERQDANRSVSSASSALRAWLAGSAKALDLAKASLRLSPCDGARICASLAQNQEGERRSAIDGMHSVLEVTPSSVDAAYAHFNLGFLWFEAGDLGRSQWHYRTASLSESRSPEFLPCWFTTSLLVGDMEEVLCAARGMADLEDEQILGSSLELLKASKIRGGAMRKFVSVDLVHQVERALPEQARRVARVLA